jgi:hypothetical protein
VKDKKAFGIGFHITGTSSLATALAMLGYRVTGGFGVDDPNIEKNVYRIAGKLVQRYDAFQDNPWTVLYKFLDKIYPQSKFILTIRDTRSWLNSIVKHFGKNET